MWNLLESKIEWISREHSASVETYETREAARAALANRYKELSGDPEYVEGNLDSNEAWIHFNDAEFILEITEVDTKKATIQDVRAEYNEESGNVYFVAEVNDDEEIVISHMPAPEKPSFTDKTLESDQTDYEQWYDAALSEDEGRGG